MVVSYAYGALGALLLVSCGSTRESGNREDEPSPANVNLPAPETSQPAPDFRGPVPLILNERIDHPLPLALQMGRLGVEATCLVFAAGGRRATPVWPIGTKWAGTAEHPRVRLPNGAEFGLGVKVNLPGGPFGRPGATDLRLSAAPGPGCPQDLYAVNGM